jgi:hypothetical protein
VPGQFPAGEVWTVQSQFYHPFFFPWWHLIPEAPALDRCINQALIALFQIALVPLVKGTAVNA